MSYFKRTRTYFASFFVLVLLLIPLSSQAALYSPRTEAEMIAYLYGRIAQLIELRDMLERGAAKNPSQSLSEYVTVETYRALEVTDTTAFLRGEVVLHGGATATAWFEYGQDDDFLDQKTSKMTVRSAYERAVRKEVRNLEEDERYYFRIVTEDKNKNVKYGNVYTFRTDEEED